MTRPARVVDGAERRHRAGLDARASRASARPSRTRSGRWRRAAGAAIFSSITASSSAVTRNSASFLSLRNRFLVWPPGIVPRSACDCSTVNSGGCVDRRVARCRGGRGRRTGRRGWRAWRLGIRRAIAGLSDFRRWFAKSLGALLAIGTALRYRLEACGRLPNGCGCSSGVEHDLAKVGVEGSNPFARSNIIKHLAQNWSDCYSAGVAVG